MIILSLSLCHMTGWSEVIRMVWKVMTRVKYPHERPFWVCYPPPTQPFHCSSRVLTLKESRRCFTRLSYFILLLQHRLTAQCIPPCERLGIENETTAMSIRDLRYSGGGSTAAAEERETGNGRNAALLDLLGREEAITTSGGSIFRWYSRNT